MSRFIGFRGLRVGIDRRNSGRVRQENRRQANGNASHWIMPLPVGNFHLVERVPQSFHSAGDFRRGTTRTGGLLCFRARPPRVYILKAKSGIPHGIYTHHAYRQCDMMILAIRVRRNGADGNEGTGPATKNGPRGSFSRPSRAPWRIT